MGRTRHLVVAWIAAMSIFGAGNDSALAAASELDSVRHGAPTPSAAKPSSGNNHFSVLNATTASHEKAKPTVFQVASYRSVQEDRQTLDSLLSDVFESKTLVTILAGFGIVSMIARRRIV